MLEIPKRKTWIRFMKVLIANIGTHSTYTSSSGEVGTFP